MKYGEPEWQTSSIFEAQDESVPHRACLLCDGAVSDDRLRRSEVCCAASLMAARLQKAKKTGDRIVPVGTSDMTDRLELMRYGRFLSTPSLDTRRA